MKFLGKGEFQGGNPHYKYFFCDNPFGEDVTLRVNQNLWESSSATVEIAFNGEWRKLSLEEILCLPEAIQNSIRKLEWRAVKRNDFEQ